MSVLYQKLFRRRSQPFFKILLLALTAGCAHSEDLSSPIVLKNEVALQILVRDLDSPLSTLVCSIENRSSKAILYESSSPMNGFRFRLYDATDSEIAPRNGWDLVNSPNTAILRSVVSFIEPGGKAELAELPLDKAFGSEWRMAKRLEVVWDTGDPRTRFRDFDRHYTDANGLGGTFDVRSLELIESGGGIVDNQEHEMGGRAERRVKDPEPRGDSELSDDSYQAIGGQHPESKSTEVVWLAIGVLLLVTAVVFNFTRRGG